MPFSAEHDLKPELSHLEATLTRMAAFVENQLQNAILAFERRDIAAAEHVIGNDQRIDEYDLELETRAVALLASAKLPLESVRHVTTIMKVSGELERVGDLAKNVSKRTLVLSREAPTRPILGVVRMGRASLLQLADILNAYAARNLDAAKAVWSGDDELDELYNSVFQEILAVMMEDPAHVNACTHLVFTAKNFERVGDHATNIAEALYFLITGSVLSDERPKGDETSTTVVTPPLSIRSGAT